MREYRQEPQYTREGGAKAPGRPCLLPKQSRPGSRASQEVRVSRSRCEAGIYGCLPRIKRGTYERAKSALANEQYRGHSSLRSQSRNSGTSPTPLPHSASPTQGKKPRARHSPGRVGRIAIGMRWSLLAMWSDGSNPDRSCLAIVEGRHQSDRQRAASLRDLQQNQNAVLHGLSDGGPA